MCKITNRTMEEEQIVGAWNGIRGKVEENDGRVDRLVINDRCQARFNRSVSPRLFFSITLSPSRPAPSSTKRVAAVRERETGRFVPDKNSNRDRAKGRWRVSRYRLVYNKPINSTVRPRETTKERKRRLVIL